MAILVPKSWNARENTTVTYTATGKEDGITPFPIDVYKRQVLGWDVIGIGFPIIFQRKE